MFDIVSKQGKVQYQQEMVRLSLRLENGFAKAIEPLLNEQYKLAASSVERGNTNIDKAINKAQFPMVSLFVQQYKKILTVFGNETLKRFEESEKKKETTMQMVYWRTVTNWANKQAAKKVVGIGNVTKRKIGKIISNGMEKGKSNSDISKRILESSKKINKSRARKIARTETHTVANYASQEATNSTGVDFKREWISAHDERTRIKHAAADGEIVGMKEPFKRTGESLMYPGDPKGRAGNIINCRCVVLFHRAERSIRKPSGGRMSTREDEVANIHPKWDYTIIEAAQEVLKNKYGITSSFKEVTNKVFSESEQLYLINRIGGEIDRLSSVYKDINTKGIKILNFVKSQVTSGDGVYIEGQKFLEFGTVGRPKDFIHLPVKIGRNEFNVIRNSIGIFEHELGHSIHLTDKKINAAWEFLLKKAGDNDTVSSGMSKLAKDVSKYAGTNERELFAESFAVFVNPNYTASKVRLPSAIEKFMEKHIGKVKE